VADKVNSCLLNWMTRHASVIFTVSYTSIKCFRGNNLQLNTTSGQVCFTQTSVIEMNDKRYRLQNSPVVRCSVYALSHTFVQQLFLRALHYVVFPIQALR